MNKMAKNDIFTLKKYEGNAYKFVNGFLFATHQYESGNIEHFKIHDEWCQVSKEAFNSDREYYDFYKYAKDEKNKRYLSND
tara:strand:+ start:526 stop:768 length:243 start_codon:yes stop_codon:yes gene_type:complete